MSSSSMIRRPLPALTRRRALGALTLGAGLLLPWAADADAWPDRPVTFIVPFGPGASNDIFTRYLANSMSQRLGRPFIVDNRPGAGGFTGSNVVVHSAPDGYTLLEMANSIVDLKPTLNVPLDPLVDLTPIAAFASSPTALVVPAKLPVRTVREFVDYAKARPGGLFYGFTGIGTTQQIHMEMFARLVGIQITGVNYKSSSDAQTDMLAGRTQAMFVTVASTLGQIESGDLRLLGYTDSNHPPDSPAAPTIAQAGFPGMEKAQIWWGIFGPRGMPPALVQAVNQAVNQAASDPAVVAFLAKSGATPLTTTPERFIAMIHDEAALFASLASMILGK